MEERWCRSCGSRLRPEVRVCTACGQPAPDRAPLSGEHGRPDSEVATTLAVARPVATPAAAPSLVRFVTTTGAQYDLAGDQLTMGRHETNDIVITDDGVSRHHARAFVQDDAIIVEDLNSTNGTFHNGRRIDARAALRDGDIVTIGETHLRLTTRAPTGVERATLAADAGTTQVIATLPPLQTATLYLRRGPGAPRTIVWRQDWPFTIGRAEDSSLVVLDGAISRHHTELRLHDGQPVVADLGSANGTALNGRLVEVMHALRPGDIVTAEPVEFIYEPPADATTPAELMRQDGRGEYALGGATTTIGGPGCDIDLHDPAAGALRVTIERRFSDYWLLPAGDALTINTVPVRESVLLEPGDAILVGGTRLIFRQAEAEHARASRPFRALSLREIAPFRELDEDTFELLRQAGSEFTAPAGEVLITHADPKRWAKQRRTGDHGLLVILEGEARVSGPVGDDWDAALALARLGPGDYIGERTLAYGHPYSYDVEASSPVRAFRVTPRSFDQLKASSGALLGFFKDKVARRGLVKWLREVPLFGRLPEETLAELAGKLRLQSFPAGDILARKGEPAQTFYLIASGSVRVESVEQGALTLLSTLTEGKYFGEQVAAAEPYPHSAIAATAVEAYVLKRDEYLALASDYPAAFSFGAAGVPASVILQRTAPFSTLAPEIVALAVRDLRAKRFRAGETVIYQDDPGGSAFYIIADGEVEVRFRASDGNERSLAKLTAGQSFGEGALLTGTPRNATVQALTDCQLLTLYRQQFDEVVAKAPSRFGAFLGHTFNARFRPKQIPNVEIFEQVTTAGTSYILNNRERNAYVSLSEQGLFIWKLLDGEHTMNDIAAAYYQQYKTLAMGVMFSTIMNLQQLGFLDVRLEEMIQRFRPRGRPSILQRALFVAASVFKAKWEFRQAHAIFKFIYHGFARLFFLRPVLVLLAVLNVAGVAAFGYMLLTGEQLDNAEFGVVGVVSLIILQALVPVTHEIGHGVTMIHIKRRVLGAGVGINLGMVMAYVNTTDAWMATRGQRIAVTLGGILVTTTEAAIASLLLLVVDNDFVRTLCVTAAFSCYFGLLVNVAPMLPSDGYNLLMDIMAIPDLRPRALRYMFTGQLFRDLIRRQMSREQKTLAAFGVIVIGFLIVFGLQLVITVTRFLTGPLQARLPDPVVIVVEVLLILLSMSLFVMAILKDAGFAGRQRG